MNKTTVFDLASLTKPLVTAISVMTLYDRRMIRLENRIDKYLPEFKSRVQGSKTLRQLMTHTAGFPPWFPMYSIPPEQRLAFLASEDRRTNQALYSCLGYIILGQIVEKITRTALDLFFRDIIKGLALKKTAFRPDQRMGDIAATENHDLHERKKCEALGLRLPSMRREYLIRGEVHDGNSHYGYRGVAGNAGLFSNASELALFMRAYIQGGIVSPRSVKMMTTNFTGGRRGRGLGWMLDIYPGRLSPAAYGHTGFTGTMLCFDPNKGLMVILLSNDIHPRVKPGNMPPVRNQLMKIVSREFFLKMNE